MSTDEERGGTKPRGWVWAAVAVLVVVVAIVAVVVVQTRDTDAGADDAGQTSEVARGTWTIDPLGRNVWVPENSAGDVLPQQAAGAERVIWSDGSKEITPPVGVQIQKVGAGIEVPFSASDGPTGFTEDGVVTTGYAHTGQGAVLFAADTVGRSLAGRDWGEKVMNHRSIDPKESEQQGQDVDPDKLATSNEALLARHFRVDECTPKACTVDLLSASVAELSGADKFSPQAPERSLYVKTTWDLVWQDGRWIAAGLSSDMPRIESLAGWSKWS